MRPQLDRIQGIQGGGAASGASDTYAQLADQLSGFGAMDVGALALNRDLNQRSQAVGLAVGVLNARNRTLRDMIASLADKSA